MMWYKRMLLFWQMHIKIVVHIKPGDCLLLVAGISTLLYQFIRTLGARGARLRIARKP